MSGRRMSGLVMAGLAGWSLCASAALFTFTDADPADSNWSTPGNWLNDTPPAFVDNTATVLVKSAVSAVDTNFTIQKLVLDAGVKSNTVLSGAGLLTIDTSTNGNANLIENRASNVNFRLEGRYVFDNSFANYKVNQILNAGNTNTSVTFGPASSITLNDDLYTAGPGAVIFEGALSGVRRVRKLMGRVTFGPTARNGNSLWVEMNSATLTVNTTNFMEGGLLSVTWASSLILNASNSIAGQPDLDPDTLFTMTINADTAFGRLDLNADSGGTRTNTFSLGPDLKALTFKDSSLLNWGDETLAVTNFRSGVIRFGTNSLGLTSTQLKQVKADGPGAKGLKLDKAGWLIAIPPPAGTVIAVK